MHGRPSEYTKTLLRSAPEKGFHDCLMLLYFPVLPYQNVQRTPAFQAQSFVKSPPKVFSTSK